jgi:tetratricopeptide (TPR) repeat protein
MSKFVMRFCFLLLIANSLFCQQIPHHEPLFKSEEERYPFPDKKGALLITPVDLSRDTVTMNEDNSQLTIENALLSPMTLTAFMRAAEKPGDSKTCRETLWPREESEIKKVVQMKDFQRREQGNLALVEYTVPEFNGKSTNQRHIHAYLTGGDLWVEIHLTKLHFKAEDQAWFDAVLNSLKINPAYENNSMDDWRWGSMAANDHDGAREIHFFQQSVNLDKVSPTLTQEKLRGIISELAYRYEETGNLVKAEETARYGISLYRDYLQFHYVLACVYAQKEKMDETVAELKLSYAKPPKYPEEEALPDPLKFHCFSKLAKQDNFIDAVHEMEPKGK